VCGSRHNGAVTPFDPSTKGKLLVATPPLGDPNFDRSVVYMLEHSEAGAVGLVLNRPGPETAVEGLGEWIDRISPPFVVFVGGPVELDALIALASADHPNEEAWTTLQGDVGTVDLSVEPSEVAALVSRLRIFRGYAGWGAMQLESELDAGAWMVLPAEPEDLFTPQPEHLWRDVLRRQGGRIAWVANAPDDLELN
jgi:putative transcriptional regulator